MTTGIENCMGGGGERVVNGEEGVKRRGGREVVVV